MTNQRLLAQGIWEHEPAPCNYHVGYPKDECRRCGAALYEHYPGSHPAIPKSIGRKKHMAKAPPLRKRGTPG